MYVTIDEYLWLFHFFLLILSWHSSMFHLFSKSFTFYSVPSVARPRSGSGDADQGLQFDALDRRQLVPHEPLSRNFFFVSRPRWNTRWNARWNACWNACRNTLNLFLFCFAHSTRRSWWIWPTNRALWSSTKSPPSDWSEPSDCYRPRLSSFSYLKKKLFDLSWNGSELEESEYCVRFQWCLITRFPWKLSFWSHFSSGDEKKLRSTFISFLSSVPLPRFCIRIPTKKTQSIEKKNKKRKTRRTVSPEMRILNLT